MSDLTITVQIQALTDDPDALYIVSEITKARIAYGEMMSHAKNAGQRFAEKRDQLLFQSAKWVDWKQSGMSRDKYREWKKQNQHLKPLSFEEWIEQNLAMNKRHAYNYIALATYWDTVGSQCNGWEEFSQVLPKVRELAIELQQQEAQQLLEAMRKEKEEIKQESEETKKLLQVSQDQFEAKIKESKDPKISIKEFNDHFRKVSKKDAWKNNSRLIAKFKDDVIIEANTLFTESYRKTEEGKQGYVKCLITLFDAKLHEYQNQELVETNEKLEHKDKVNSDMISTNQDHLNDVNSQYQIELSEKDKQIGALEKLLEAAQKAKPKEVIREVEVIKEVIKNDPKTISELETLRKDLLKVNDEIKAMSSKSSWKEQQEMQKRMELLEKELSAAKHALQASEITTLQALMELTVTFCHNDLIKFHDWLTARLKVSYEKDADGDGYFTLNSIA